MRCWFSIRSAKRIAAWSRLELANRLTELARADPTRSSWPIAGSRSTAFRNVFIKPNEHELIAETLSGQQRGILPHRAARRHRTDPPGSIGEHAHGLPSHRSHRYRGCRRQLQCRHHLRGHCGCNAASSSLLREPGGVHHRSTNRYYRDGDSATSPAALGLHFRGPGMSWVFWACLSAVFAGLTAVLAKLGVSGIDSNLATAIRTAVVLLLSWSIVFWNGVPALAQCRRAAGCSCCFPVLPRRHRGFVTFSAANGRRFESSADR